MQYNNLSKSRVVIITCMLKNIQIKWGGIMQFFLLDTFLKILEGIIGTLVLYFFKAYAHKLLDWFLSKNKKCSDKFYTSIACHKGVSLESIGAFSLLFLVFIALTFASLKVDSGLDYTDLISKAQISKAPEEIKLSKELLDKIDADQRIDRISFFKNHYLEYRIMQYFLVVFTIFIVIFIFIIIILATRRKEMIDEFLQKIDIIAPFISTNDVLVLKSKWARMKSREDYLAIFSEIDKHLKE